MKKIYKDYKETEITRMFDQLNIFFYFCGFKAFWVSDLNFSRKVVKIYDKVTILADILIALTMLANFVPFFTLKDLPSNMQSDLNIFTFLTPVIFQNYYTCLYYKAEVRDILYHLVVVCKDVNYDKEAALQIAKIMKRYIGALAFACMFMLVERVTRSLVNVILYDQAFHPYVTAWTHTHETTSAAGLILQLLYMAFVCFISLRASGVYSMILILLLTLKYQFKDLQNYFYNLDVIFEDSCLSQKEKERKYEEGLKKGIYLHVLSLSCVRRCQYVCKSIFSTQLLLLLTALIVILRPILISEGFATKIPQLPILSNTLILLALIMCNSGNVTFEAQRLSNAMYASGWHNCRGMSSVRVRKLLVNAISQAQQPVVFTLFSIIELSYENWIVVVKTSYSMFSVFY